MSSKQIPEDAVGTYEKIKNSLKGENYTYESFEVTKVADSDRGKIRFAMKVYVPQAERVTAAANIKEALGESDITVEVKDETQLDVFIDDLGKKIRLDVKPDSKKGSGGGSEATRIQEGAQCVYTAIRFYKGEVDQVSEEDLQFGMKLVQVPGLKIEEIQSLPKVWKESSMRGADKIIKGIKELGAPKQYYFVRGDNDIDDGAIKKAFLRVKKQTNIKSEDKWNPADIWIAKRGFDISPIKNLNTAAEINKFIDEKFTSKELIGVSLKKSEGITEPIETSSAKFSIMNREPPEERRAKVSSYKWVDSNRTGGYDLYFENKGKQSIDVYVYYGSGEFDKFQLRNFGGKKASWQIELKGATAAHGRCGGGNVASIVNEYAPNAMPWDNTNFYNSCNPTNRNATIGITREISELLVEFDAKNIVRGLSQQRDLAHYRSLIAYKSQEWRYSKLNGLRFLKALRDNPSKADQIIQALYLFASSQLDFSSAFVKVF